MSSVSLLAAVAAGICCAGVSAGPLPGVKTRADRAAWRSLLRWPASWEHSWRQTGVPGAGIEKWPVRGGVHVVAVECFEGPYQGVSIVYLVRSRARVTGPLRFRIYADAGNGVPTARTRTGVAGVLTFHPRSGRLTVLDKARGLGDCGIYSVFRLGKKSFVPVEARAKTACDGKPPFDPGRWPKLPLP